MISVVLYKMNHQRKYRKKPRRAKNRRRRRLLSKRRHTLRCHYLERLVKSLTPLTACMKCP
jgi:hypothetical protein